MANIELKGFKGLRELHSINQSAVTSQPFEKVEKLSLEFLRAGKYQPRKNFNEEAIQELADSIKSQGIIQPIIVRKISAQEYEIIAGERRCRAAKLAGLTHIPAIVKEIKDDVAMAFSLIENIQRENLNPIEEAAAFDRFRNDFSMTHDEIAEMVGRSRTSITNALRLLQLNPQVKEFLAEGRLDMGHARALLSLTDENQFETARIIIEKKLSVREAEKLVTAPKAHKVNKPNVITDKSKQWETILSKNIKRKVTVQVDSKEKGKIVIYTDSLLDMDWMIEHLALK